VGKFSALSHYLIFDISKVGTGRNQLCHTLGDSSRNKYNVGWAVPTQSLKNDSLKIVSVKRLPETTAYVRITRQCWQQGKLEGEVRASDYQWRFQWNFRGGKLLVRPSLGRALIFEPLGRFLERHDYQLEPGGDYEFTVRANW
jgi:hypothetical protein